MMEKLEPKKERSPIESLKFQKKSDYKKFRNFIKKKTKELEGVAEPKDNKLKSILRVGVGGLGLLAIGGLLRGKGKDNDDTSGKFKTPFIVGRRNPSDLPDPKIPNIPNLALGDSIAKTSKIPKPVKTPVKIETPVKVNKPVNVKQGSLLTSKLKPRKNLGVKTPVTTSSRKPFTPIEKPVKTETGSSKGGGKKINKATSNIPFDYGTARYDTGLTYEEFLKKANLSEDDIKAEARRRSYETTRGDQYARQYGTAGTQGESSAGAGAGGASRKPTYPQPTLDDLLFGKGGDKPLKINNPLLMRAEMVFDYTKTRLSQLKSKGSKILDSISKTTQKLTPEFLKSDLAKPLLKSKTKTGFFVIDLLFAGQAFADLFKPKDNLRTAVVDLFNAYNNLKYKDDPSKLKYYITESSDERIRAYHMQKNKEIRLLKEKAGVNLGGPQNILVVPENKQNNEVTTNIPIKKGGTEISFVPIEPLNSVGTDILLHKLNA